MLRLLLMKRLASVAAAVAVFVAGMNLVAAAAAVAPWLGGFVVLPIVAIVVVAAGDRVLRRFA